MKGLGKGFGTSTQTLFKHILIHTGVYFALTGKRVGAGVSSVEVWGWLVRVFREKYPVEYSILARRQKDRVNWKTSGGKYTEKDQEVLNKVFTMLYAGTLHTPLLSEEIVDLLLKEMKMEKFGSLAKEITQQRNHRQQSGEQALEEVFCSLADLSDREFDAHMQFAVGRGNLEQFATYSVDAVVASYRQIGKTVVFLLDDFTWASKQVMTFTGKKARKTHRAVRKHAPPKKTVVQKSRSVRRKVFGKHAS